MSHRETPAAAEPLVAVENLWIRFPGRRGPVAAVAGVSFSMGREKLAIVGESGSGKSLTARTIMGLLPEAAEVTADRLSLQGDDLRGLREKDFARLRGKRMAMILQDPKQSLNPIMTAGQQIVESCRLHLGDSRRTARERALELLHKVRIDNPQRVFGLYPHEVSGGMGQRIMIAMMLAAEPDLLVADEPTSALDVSVRAEVLDLIESLVVERGMGLILISHDLDLVSAYSDRVVVMYSSRVMETLPASELAKASHPYTRGLIGCRPPLDHRVETLPVLKRDPAWLS
jgi:peptide/nickel transport system ATP-binding protein